MRAEAARYVMIGGFLGAGKTTAILRLAERLARGGLRVGLIANDQGSGLADTRRMAGGGFPTREIPGGCFCCRFDSLVEAARELEESARPDVLVAEPVGSCTDLVATVSYPLRRMYGDRFRIAPLSVLVDPRRARRVLGLDRGARFSPKVEYIYLKQLEEAGLIVINKIDLLEDGQLGELGEELGRRFPRARILEASARDGRGLAPWFEALEGPPPPDADPMEVDYDRYADGEALLGWLNASASLESAAPLDGNRLVRELAEALRRGLEEEGAEIAHLKMTLCPGESLGDLASVSVVAGGLVPELGERLEAPVRKGQLILNLRAEASPEALEQAARKALVGFPSLALEHLESFRPGRPRPTWREGPPRAA